MSNTTYVCLTVLVWAGLAVPSAAGQGLGPRVGGTPSAPTVSPYLNLLRGSNSPTLNYYGLVRPQFQTNAGLQALQQQVLLAQGAGLSAAAGPDQVVVTGTAAVFMNLGGYFQSGIGGGRPAGVSSTPTRPASIGRLPSPRPR